MTLIITYTKYSASHGDYLLPHSSDSLFLLNFIVGMIF
jgi:hypothetical protein